MIVREPGFFTELAKTFDRVPLDDWKTYLAWDVIRNAAPMLSEAFVMEDFEFSSKTLMGIPEIQPRWKRGVAMVEQSLGQAVGKLYVAKYFPPESKEKMKLAGREPYREGLSPGHSSGSRLDVCRDLKKPRPL